MWVTTITDWTPESNEMSPDSLHSALRSHLLRRRERVARLGAALVRAIGRALRHAERYGSYACGRERELIGTLQELHHQADALRRTLVTKDRGKDCGKDRCEERCRAALHRIGRTYARVVERSRPLGPDSRIVRELRRARSPLKKLASAYGADRSSPTRERWSISAAATVARAEPPGRPT